MRIVIFYICEVNSIFFKLLKNMEPVIDKQLAEIRKFSNHAIIAIWFAGVNAILVFMVYYMFFSGAAGSAEKNRFNAMQGINQLSDQILFSDKTTLVNMGLKIQEMSDLTEVKSHGSIAIRKIKYDQQQKDPKAKQPAKPGFFVGSIPK